ncbi:MAG: disulfide bond formation protein B [Candidatus Paceibacterota bacterium]|jgi:disulfide bond formation protein DsbB
MSPSVEIFNLITAIGALALFIVWVIVFVIFIFNRTRENSLLDFISKYAILIAFGHALIAMIISLIYSVVLGYAPCDLCWYQRAFLYPLVFIMGYALIKKDHSVLEYGIILSSIGVLIALFHNYIYYFNISAAPCPANGVSCTLHYVSVFGFISIPFMALAAFISILVPLLIARFYSPSNIFKI